MNKAGVNAAWSAVEVMSATDNKKSSFFIMDCFDVVWDSIIPLAAANVVYFFEVCKWGRGS